MIGQKIIELRAKKDWTQAQLAKEAGISQSMIAYYENGNPPSKKALIKIADIFKVPVKTFGSIPKKAKKVSLQDFKKNDFQRLANSIQNLRPEYQKMIIDHISTLLELQESKAQNDQVQNVFKSKRK